MESAFFTVADWVANPRSNSIRRKNRRSVLPPRLMDLLFYFAQHPMEVVSRQEIIDNCWDRDVVTCLLYTSPSPRDLSTSRMPSSA